MPTKSILISKSSSLMLQAFYIALALACLTPYFSSGSALFCGMIFGILFGNPFSNLVRQFTPKLLQLSVVGLGAGMNLAVVGQVGINGIGYTAVGIILTLLIGILIGRTLSVERNTSLLVSVGTAICGGSAIAAVAPTIRAKPQEISVALATVFFLNATALFVFPPLGHWFNLSEVQFGLWSALAVHDTSSVIGTAVEFGPRAAEIATTVKLARALWIIPVSLGIGALWRKTKSSGETTAPKYPWFILGFLAAAAVVTWIPELSGIGHQVSSIARRTLVLTLFFIGSGLSKATLKNIGIKPFVQGVGLWFVVASATLFAIKNGWILQ